MILNDHRLQTAEKRCDLWEILWGHSFGIKKIATIIELDVRGRRQVGKCVTNLSDNRARGNLKCGGVLPKIAHQACVRAFSIGQKNSGYRIDRALTGAFFLKKKGLRLPRIVKRSRRPCREDFFACYDWCRTKKRGFWHVSSEPKEKMFT